MFVCDLARQLGAVCGHCADNDLDLPEGREYADVGFNDEEFGLGGFDLGEGGLL